MTKVTSVRAKMCYEKHPDYQIKFQDKNQGIWIIDIFNGEWCGYLFSEALENNRMLFVSESTTLGGYDSKTNTFYKYIPKAEFGKLTKIDKIDAKALGEFQY